LELPRSNFFSFPVVSFSVRAFHFSAGFPQLSACFNCPRVSFFGGFHKSWPAIRTILSSKQRHPVLWIQNPPCGLYTRVLYQRIDDWLNITEPVLLLYLRTQPFIHLYALAAMKKLIIVPSALCFFFYWLLYVFFLLIVGGEAPPRAGVFPVK